MTYAEAKHGIDGTGWGRERGIAAESMGIAFVEFSVRRCRAKRSKMVSTEDAGAADFGGHTRPPAGSKIAHANGAKMNWEDDGKRN